VFPEEPGDGVALGVGHAYVSLEPVEVDIASHVPKRTPRELEA
jgi:hypothetical protein